MRRLLGLVAVAVVGALLVAPAAEAKGAKNLFGLNYVFKEMNGKDARMLKKSGAKTVRWQMQWPQIEPTSGHFNWSVQDKIVGDLAAEGDQRAADHVAHAELGAELHHAVQHQATDGLAGSKDAWQGFLQAAVKRYGPDGKFWKRFKRQHHNKKPRPIKTWEIWNEPNLAAAMSPPSPELYAKLLKLSKGAIKAWIGTRT